jgi:hypothetical protein
VKFIHVTRLDVAARMNVSINTAHIMLVEDHQRGEHFSSVTLTNGTRMLVSGSPELILAQISGEVDP